jgi:hypothetical protein
MLVDILIAGARFAKLRFVKVRLPCSAFILGAVDPVRAVLYPPRLEMTETGRTDEDLETRRRFLRQP